MADSTPSVGPNFRAVVIKGGALRLSDAEGRDTTDYAELIVGDGAPSGAYGRASGTTMLYLRKDAASAAHAAYVTVNGGTDWAALLPANPDHFVLATTSLPDATGGGTDSLLAVDLYRLDGTTRIASARQVALRFVATNYSGTADNSPTLGTVTKGSIVASLSGLFVVETDSSGQFACTVTNTTDETLYCVAITSVGGVSALSKACVVVGCVPDAVTWSA